MASDAGMGESPGRWRRAAEAAQDPRGTENSALVLPRSAAAQLGLPAYPELSYALEKGCPWRGTQGCLGPIRELSGSRLGCPCPLAPPCHPKDGAELPSLLHPRNGQPKAGWGEPCKDHPGQRWAEAVLAPLALYSHSYQRYPPPIAGLDTPHPAKPRSAVRGDAAGDPPAFRHCPFLLEAKHSPFLLPPAEPPFYGGAVGQEGSGPGGDGRFGALDWRLGSFPPPWAQPLYMGVPARCKAALPPFEDCCSSGNKVGKTRGGSEGDVRGSPGGDSGSSIP